MRLIRATTITPAMLTACNVPETDYPLWSSGTAYVPSPGTPYLCIYEHKIYECLIGHTNAQPDLNLDGTTPKWLDLGYDNRWKMFDQMVGSKTSQDTSITMTVAPGLIDSIAFLDMTATTISIVMTDPSAVVAGTNPTGQVYPATIGTPAIIDMITKSMVVDAYTYFFDPIITDDAAVLLGIPPYGTASISITIDYPGGTVAAGTVVFGTQKDLGLTQYSPTIGIIDYSAKNVDIFGNYTVVQRSFSKRMTCELLVDNTAVDDLQRTLASYRATPVVWVGVDEGFSSMIVYGFYKSFSIVIPYLNESTCSLEIEGLS